MHMNLRPLALAACAALLVACAKKEDGQESAKANAAAATPTTDEQKFGYAVGVNLGNSLAPVKEYVDVASLKQGLDDALAGGELKMDEAAREEIHNKIAQKLQEKQAKEHEEQAAKGKSEGEAFLAENAKKDGVKTTASGLQYEVEREGSGPSPKATDQVTVNYRGTLIDGTEFDSSYSRGEPVTFELDKVIPGWTEGVQLMNKGAKFKFYIPSDLAYGERGAGNRIPPNSTLIFEVELLGIGDDKGDAAKAADSAKADKK